jgi:hypothetical protein
VARILEIRRTGPFAHVLLEVHECEHPPFEHWVRTRIPRGRDPQPGDDVYWTDHSAPDSTVRVLRIKWGAPPNYGAAPDDVAAREQVALEALAPLWRDAHAQRRADLERWAQGLAQVADAQAAAPAQWRAAQRAMRTNSSGTGTSGSDGSNSR